MKNELHDMIISGFIDDELDLPEKLAYTHRVRKDGGFYRDAVSLLEQERLIAGPVEERTDAPDVAVLADSGGKHRRFALLGALASAAAAVALFVVLGSPSPELIAPGPISDVASTEASVTTHRFVLYHPGAELVSVVGSFTGWEAVPMKPVGPTGYWEVTLPLTAGEHRYAFMLEDGTEIPDPSVIRREQDDFGGQNSLIIVDSV